MPVLGRSADNVIPAQAPAIGIQEHGDVVVRAGTVDFEDKVAGGQVDTGGHGTLEPLLQAHAE